MPRRLVGTPRCQETRPTAVLYGYWCQTKNIYDIKDI